MYGQLYRHLLLPLFDGVVKGRRTMAHWRDAEESQWWSRERLEGLQLESLQGLLQHAHKTCSYYTEDWNARGLKDRKSTRLNSSH